MNVLVEKYNINNLELSNIIISCLDFKVELLSYGACLNKIYLDDNLLNVTPLDIIDHFNNGAKFGKTIGRYAGRIKDGKFKLNNKEYQLDLNNGNNCLHGGINSISEKNFDYEINEYSDKVEVIFSLLDKENLFPGDVKFEIKYIIYKNYEIEIEYLAFSNKDTIINLTNHTYFNLSSNLVDNILNHRLYLNASKFTELNNNMNITSIKEVLDCVDFRKPKLIGKDIECSYLQDHATRGYDHAFILDERNYNTLQARLEGDKYLLEVYTTYPCCVIYTANYQDKVQVSPNKYPVKYEGICFECQYMPDDINYSNQTILKANSKYLEKTKFVFRRV